ncbi:MAG: O-antigen ligase family protein, partial [Clostridium sp.]
IDGFLSSLPQWQINTIQARPIVFSYNTNNLNASLALLIPICLFSIYKFESVIAKIWFSIVSIIAFALVVITTSRTGYMAFLFMAGIFLLYSLINIRRLGIKQMIYPLVITIGMTLAFNFAPLMMNIKPVEGEEIQHTTTLTGKLHALESMVAGEETSEYSTLNRMAIINDVLKGVISEKRLQGFGVGNVEQYIKEQGNSGSIYSPHCYPIEILGDFGVPGVVLFGIYYLYLLIYNFILAIKKKSTICFAMVASLIAFAPASFGPSSITYVFSYWIMMGLAISCIQVYKDDYNGYRRTSDIKEYSLV